MAEQNFKNHARFVPVFHFGVLLTLLVNVGWSIYRLTQGLNGESIIALLVSVALFMLGLSLRGQILTVQDRVIRLESRLRMREVLPAALAGRASELPVKHHVAIRFASDAELPSLVQDVLDGKLGTPTEIKQAVKQWQADHLRA